MLSQGLYVGDRDVFATCVMEANRMVNDQFIPKIRSLEGNIIVRVAPGGDEFRIIVTDDADDTDRIKLATGPYRCN
jgi:hypothetical protein